LPNDLAYLFAIGYVEPQRKNRVAEKLRELRKSDGSSNLIAAPECGFSPDAAKTARGARG